MADFSTIIAAIDDMLLGRIQAGGLQDIQIGGRRLTAYPIPDLIKLRSEYQKLQNTETRGGSSSYGYIRR